MREDLESYLLHLADNALLLGHRNSEWCGHGPVLEQDIALTNISLDLLGQARYFYQYAAELHGNNFTEDSFAYLRDANGFKNCLICELPNGHWGQTVLRQFIFSAYQFELYTKLQQSTDERIAGIAVKSLKETTYHLRWSRQWVIRLGDGTIESRNKMIDAWENLKYYVNELFEPAEYEIALAEKGIAVNTETLLPLFNSILKEVFELATIPLELPDWTQRGGKSGLHTEHLGYILTEMQFLQRAYPAQNW
jgi:ring-1,2-phenylacetyl-CoA epoxidase subunit PaaC